MRIRKSGTGQQHLANKRLVNTIFRAILNYYDITEDDICSKSRKKEFTEPRHIAASLIYSFTANNQSITGKRIGDKNHATVVHSLRNVVEWHETSRPFRIIVNKVINYINYDYGNTFTFQQVIDAREGKKGVKYNTDNLMDSFNAKIKQLCETEDTIQILEAVKELKLINGEIRSRQVQNEFKAQLKLEQDAKEQKTN